MSILLITSNEVFDITTKYFSRTLSVSVLKYIGLKCKKRAPLLGLAKFIYQLSIISVAFFHTRNSKRKIKHDCFWSFSITQVLTQCSQVTIRFHPGRRKPTYIFAVCMEIKLSMNNYVTSQKRVRPGHITLTLKTGPQMTYKKEKHE